MNIDSVTAQHIVEQIAPSLGTDIWIVDRSSHVLASTQAKRPHLQRLPIDATDGTSNDDYLRLPLCYGDKEVGALIIGGSSRRNCEAVHMAKILAELIIYQATVFEQLVDRQLALNKFAYHLLHGQVEDNPFLVLEEASLLQISLTTPRVVIVLDLAPLLMQMQAGHPKQSQNDPSHLSQWQQLRRRLLHQVSQHFPETEANFSAFPDERWLVVLAAIDPSQPEKWRQQIKYLVQHTLDELERMTGIRLRAGMGDYYPDWQSLPRSYADACFALEIGHLLNDTTPVLTIADLGLAAFVCAENATISSKLTARLLVPLLNEPELLSTLETFLNLNLSPSQAAQKLSVHRHTLAYRLQKIAELTGADPRNFQDATRFLAALLWHKCRQPTA